jgi:hypothetical protein
MIAPFGILAALSTVGSLGATTPPPSRPPPRVVEVVSQDYAFFTPTELPAGAVTFRFSNKGTHIHEMTMALLVDGTTPQAVIDAVNAKRPLKSMIEASVGMLFARPGERSSAGLTTRLEPGRNYLVICRFQDSASAPTHARMGMVNVIRAGAGPSAGAPPAATDTIVGTNYAFDTRRGLTAGRHRLRFANRGTVAHEMNVALLRRGVTPEQLYQAARAGADLNRFVDEWLGLLSGTAGTLSASTLDVSLRAGRTYVLMCELTNDDHSPSHIMLGMFGVIRPPAARVISGASP